MRRLSNGQAFCYGNRPGPSKGKGMALNSAVGDTPSPGSCRPAQTLLACGFTYYLYNEMGFRVLNRLDPVSAAVGNTVK